MTQPNRYYLFADYNKMRHILTPDGVDTREEATSQAHSWIAQQASIREQRAGRAKGVMPKVLIYKLVSICSREGEENFR